MRIAGIYRITAPDGREYIGSSTYMVGRKCRHWSDLRMGKHHCARLQAIADELGVSALRFEPILCALPGADLVAIEQEVINEWQPELNSTLRACAPAQDAIVAAKISASAKSSQKHSMARVLNQRKASDAQSRPVVCLTDGRVFPSGYAAARHFGSKSPDNLSTALRVGTKFCGHYWVFLGSSITLAERFSAAATRSSKCAQTLAESQAACRRGVVRQSDGALFASIAEASIAAGVNHSAIVRAAKTGMRSAGSAWRYTDA